jgi:hypothetical protein
MSPKCDFKRPRMVALSPVQKAVFFVVWNPNLKKRRKKRKRGRKKKRKRGERREEKRVHISMEPPLWRMGLESQVEGKDVLVFYLWQQVVAAPVLFELLGVLTIQCPSSEMYFGMLLLHDAL